MKTLDGLVPDFRSLVEDLLEVCLDRGVEMRPYFTIRTPQEQAKLWRQSRSSEEVQEMIQKFRDNGAEFLAQTLIDVGPQHGPQVTNVPPGYSWHQFGEAVDCFWAVEGKAVWDSEEFINEVNGYQVYAQEAENLDLNPGGYWKRIKDWPHVQMRQQEVDQTYKMVDVDLIMKERFGQ